MKDILAIITPVFAEAPEPGTDFAFALAALREAHVTVLVTEIEPDSPAQMVEPDLMQGGGDEAEPLSTKESVLRGQSSSCMPRQAARMWHARWFRNSGLPRCARY